MNLSIFSFNPVKVTEGLILNYFSFLTFQLPWHSVESFTINIILDGRLKKSSERFVKKYKRSDRKTSMTTLCIIVSQPEF